MRLLLVIMLEIFARNLRRASWKHAFDTIHTSIGSALPKMLLIMMRSFPCHVSCKDCLKPKDALAVS